MDRQVCKSLCNIEICAHSTASDPRIKKAGITLDTGFYLIVKSLPAPAYPKFLTWWGKRRFMVAPGGMVCTMDLSIIDLIAIGFWG